MRWVPRSWRLWGWGPRAAGLFPEDGVTSGSGVVSPRTEVLCQPAVDDPMVALRENASPLNQL